MFELESKEFKPIELIIKLFNDNNIPFWYSYDWKNEVCSIQYEEIENEKVLSLLEDIAIKYKL